MIYFNLEELNKMDSKELQSVILQQQAELLRIIEKDVGDIFVKKENIEVQLESIKEGIKEFNKKSNYELRQLHGKLNNLEKSCSDFKNRFGVKQ